MSALYLRAVESNSEGRLVGYSYPLEEWPQILKDAKAMGTVEELWLVAGDAVIPEDAVMLWRRDE